MALGTDLRHAIRSLRRTPGFTAVAVLTLAVGIGANAAIFGLVDAVLLRPLPYPEPDRLVVAWQDYTERGGPATEWFSPGNFLDWRDQVGSFSGLAAFGGWGPTLTGRGDPVALAGGVVSHDFLSTLGARPALGRLFRPAEEEPGAPPVVVLGDRVWRDRFGADPAIVGRAVELGGAPYEVVGVLPPGFEFPMLPGADVFRPLTLDPANAPRGSVFLRVVGRLAPGVTFERAQAEAAGVAARLAEDYPGENEGVGANLDPLQDVLVGDVRAGLLVLFGGVGAVLLMACVNLAGLLLVRGRRRRQELAVRAALGAGAFRLGRLTLIESVLLSAAGGAAGLVLAGSLMDALVALSPLGLPDIFQPAMNAPVVAFTVGLALLTGVAFGVVPAVRSARADVARALRDGGSRGASHRRARGGLVAAQIAFALVLLVAAGLLTRSFLQLRAVDPGFEPEGLLVFNVTTPTSAYPEAEDVAGFYDRLLDRLAALPGAEGAGAVSSVPLGGGDTDLTFVIEGQPTPAGGREPVIWFRQATPDYHATMGIPVLEGRAFRASDRDGPPVVLLGQAAAERYFPGESAIGRRLKPGSDPDSEDPWWTVVGVVGAVRHTALDADPRVELYVPQDQLPRRTLAVLVRAASGDPLVLTPAVRGALRDLDPTLAMANVGTMASLVSGSIAAPRFLTLAIGAFAVLALLLAVIGVYGVVSQLVGQRTRELGIRVALGADRARVVGMVLREGALLVAVGAAVGLVAALAATRVLRGLLFQVTPLDPATFVAIPLLLAAAALAATWLPARRAARIDPVTALRDE